MKIESIISVAVITPDASASRALYLDALGLPLERLDGDYFASGAVAGCRHFGVARRRGASVQDLVCRAQSRLYSATRGLVLPDDAGRVYAQEHVDAVASPLGYLGSRHSRVEPERDCGMSEVIGALRQGRGVLLRCRLSLWVNTSTDERRPLGCSNCGNVAQHGVTTGCRPSAGSFVWSTSDSPVASYLESSY